MRNAVSTTKLLAELDAEIRIHRAVAEALALKSHDEEMRDERMKVEGLLLAQDLVKALAESK